MKHNQRTDAQRHEQLSKHHLVHSMAISLNAGPKGPAPSMEFVLTAFVFGAQRNAQLLQDRKDQQRASEFVFVLEHSENARWLQDRKVSRWAHGIGFGTPRRLDGCETERSSAGHGR